MRTKEIKKKEVSLFERIRKKVFLLFLNEKRVIQRKIPNYLKNDMDVAEKIVNILQKPETMRELANFIDSNPGAINLLDHDYMNSYLYNNTYSKNSIRFLSYEKQKELLLGEVEYQDKFGRRRMNNGKIEVELEHEKSIGKNTKFRNCLALFSSDVIIQAYIENEKSGGKIFDEFKIDELPQEVQLRIGLLNNKYIEKMSTDSQITFVNNNPYLMSKLGKDAISRVLQLNPQFKQFIDTSQMVTGQEAKDKKTSNIEDIKKLIYSDNYNFWKNKIDISQIKDIELFKFYPNLLKDVYNGFTSENINSILKLMIANILKYPNQLLLVDFFKELQDEFNYNLYEAGRYTEIERMMISGIKIISNDDILKKVDGEDLKDYIKNPKRDKLLEIIEKTYGEQARKILEDRPNIDIDKMQNFYIFSPKAIEEFSIGTIHHLLSYNYIKSPMIISELVRHPEKMALYKKFDSLTKDYFEETPVGIEEKLETFLNLYDLIKKIGNEELTEEMRNNLLQYIDDTNKQRPLNPINIKNVKDLKCYGSIRKEKFDEAIKKTTEIKDVKNLICKEFLGISYNESYTTVVAKQYMNIIDILNFYNIDTFMNDSRTLNSGRFEEDELDVIELLSIIHKINGIDILKKIAENLSNTQDIVINPVFFKKIRDKIPMQYSKELVRELLTPEKAKTMAEEGMEGISYTEDEGFTIIKLTGANFLLYVHNMNSYMSECNDLIADEYERWTKYEEGVSTISGILINHESPKRFKATGNVGFFQVNPNQILGMGADDINTTHAKRSMKIDFGHKLQYDYPENLVRKSKEGSSLKNYVEIAMTRRKQNVEEIEPETFGGKIMPDYVCGDINDEEYLKMFAKQMKTNIIFEIDDEAYQNREYTKIRQEKVKRKETGFMKKIKEIIDDDEER